MTGWRKATLTLCLAVGLTGTVLGQRQEQGPAFPGPGGLLMAPDVQKELKLSEEQVSKLKDALNKVMSDHKEDLQRLRQMSPEQQRKTFEAIGEATDKAIASVLDEKQQKRFQQIEWQLAGPGALHDPRVQKALKLSDEQKKKLDKIFQDADKKMRDLAQRAQREDVRQQFEQVGKQVEEQSNAVLSEEQRKTFDEMKGKKFELRRPSGGR